MGRQKKVLKCHKTEVLNSLLMKSTRSGNLADVRKWIDQGANVNVKHLKGEVTPLAAAIIGENLKHKNIRHKLPVELGSYLPGFTGKLCL